MDNGLSSFWVSCVGWVFLRFWTIFIVAPFFSFLYTFWRVENWPWPACKHSLSSAHKQSGKDNQERESKKTSELRMVL